MQSENKTPLPPPFWEKFLEELSKKTRSTSGKSRKLKRSISSVREKPAVYITLGVHGNILFSDFGYCEFDSPERVWYYLQKWCKSSKNLPIAVEIGICSLENLAKIYPVWKLLQENHVEIINPTFSQPYLRHLGEESNIRQLKFGLDILHQHEIPCHIFVSSEHALHPQLPQLLKQFGIYTVYSTARLVGGAPTSYLPKIIWKGLDNTPIKCIVNQSGIPNGQIWHGKFFQELSSLLFFAFSRPDLTWVLYENIEDVAYDFPEIAEIEEHKTEFESSNIYFSTFQDVFSNSYPFSRTIKWTIEDFPLRIMHSRLIAEVRKYEDEIINHEACLSLVSSSDFHTFQSYFENIWKQLLLAQNHDAYIVPYVTPGMYLLSQGLSNANLSQGPTIEEKCMQILDRVKKQLEIGISTKKSSNKSKNQVILNWLWKRDFLEGERLYSLPKCCLINPQTADYNSKEFPSRGKHSLKSILEWIDIPMIEHLIEDRIIEKDGFSVELEDHYKFQKLRILTNKELWFPICGCDALYITYPFGIQSTSESEGHSHRFFWINKKLVIAHKGTPYFTRKGNDFKIFLPPGTHELGVGYANSIKNAYRLAWEFFYPPQKVMVPQSIKTSQSLISIKFNDFIPSSIRKSEQGTIIRGFCVGNTVPQIAHSHLLDLNDKPLDDDRNESTRLPKWKILSYLVNIH